MNSSHPLVGTWQQEPNRGGTTSVIYTVSIKRGNFEISGTDQQNGVSLKIYRIKWDGESLRFTSLYPPTSHKANHLLKPVTRRLMTHHVAGIYYDGEAFSDREIWTKVTGNKK